VVQSAAVFKLRDAVTQQGNARAGTVATSFDTNSPLKNTFIASGLLLAPGSAGSASPYHCLQHRVVDRLQLRTEHRPDRSRTGRRPLQPTALHQPRDQHPLPTYQEWNFEVQQAIGTKMSFSLNYVGNHGSYLAVQNPGLNAYCNSTAVPFQPAGLAPCLSTLGVSTFSGLPVAPLDPRFSSVTEVSNPGVSNYNGLTAEFSRRVSRSLQVQASYTWSHALDDISNGGFLPFNFDTNTSILSPQNPFSFRQYNYGNSDYDVRNSFNLSYVYTTPTLCGWWGALLDWTISGTIFARSGLPFTVVDGASTGALGSYNYGPLTGLSLFANSVVGPLPCSSSATTSPCMTLSQFSSPVVPGSVASFGDQRRNQVYGPNFFDTDMSLMKTFHVPHWESAELQIGAQAFNLFNHPNFDQPVGDVSNSQFGSIVRTVGAPKRRPERRTAFSFLFQLTRHLQEIISRDVRPIAARSSNEDCNRRVAASKIKETIGSWAPVLTATEIRATAIARGRAIKRVNAWTAVLCGGVPALALGILFPARLPHWLAGFGAGLLWASLFEYLYHRFLLHLPGTFFAKRHLGHHASVGTPTEAEHVNLGGSPIWVVALFAINGIPVTIGDSLLGLGIAPGIFLAFAVYFITVEEVHWRIHLGEWLPPVLRASRAYHLAHHTRPDARFNIFLPVWDALLGSAGR
jgi:hypothetical protein